MSMMVRKGFSINSNVPAPSPERAKFVIGRLVELSKNAAEVMLESGLLLKEYRDNAYYKEDGYESFDAAIDAMHEKGMFEYKSRNARNLISIVEMAQQHKLSGDTLDGIGISKLREIASLPPADQKAMLEPDKKTGEPKAKKMSVADVQKEAKVKRAKAKGHDVDPLDAITFMTTATQKTFINTCIEAARRIYGLPDTVTPTGVLVDAILAEWHSSLSPEEVEASQNAGVIEGETIPEASAQLPSEESTEGSDEALDEEDEYLGSDGSDDDEPRSLVTATVGAQEDDIETLDDVDISDLDDDQNEIARILANSFGN